MYKTLINLSAHDSLGHLAITFVLFTIGLFCLLTIKPKPSTDLGIHPIHRQATHWHDEDEYRPIGRPRFPWGWIAALIVFSVIAYKLFF